MNVTIVVLPEPLYPPAIAIFFTVVFAATRYTIGILPVRIQGKKLTGAFDHETWNRKKIIEWNRETKFSIIIKEIDLQMNLKGKCTLSAM